MKLDVYHCIHSHLFENGVPQRQAVGTFDVCLARPKVCPTSVHTRLNLWLTHLSISFAKYGLVRIDHLFENGASQRLAVGTFDVCLARLARPKVCPTDIVRPHSAQLMIDASVNQFCKTWPSADWPYDSSVNKSCVMRGKALKPVPSPFLTYHVNRKIPLAKLWHLSEFRNTHVKLVCSWIPNWVKFQCPFLFKLVGDSKVPSNTAGFSFKICLKTLINFLLLLSEISHLFFAKENDWGFSHFASWSVSDWVLFCFIFYYTRDLYHILYASCHSLHITGINWTRTWPASNEAS